MNFLGSARKVEPSASFEKKNIGPRRLDRVRQGRPGCFAAFFIDGIER